ncbi:MAG: glucosaminidase domain-containing protein [Tannerellaceae bacterium]|jgi:LysM repeat protein|nr:glucosaminidase domain-containing protein [Tannerellaceae bacterium]
MHLIIKTFSLVFVFIMPILVNNAKAESHQKLSTHLKYIHTYCNLAVKKQHEYGIPASITLAQGLLESAAGQSVLAKKANNHFGIKCHDWKGATIIYDDDKKGECFRKYAHPEESYHDHAIFLKDRSRYAELFKLSTKDYKGWAKGLQKCGYATDKSYANKLIKLIEDYELYRFDSATASNKKTTTATSKTEPKKTEQAKTTVMRTTQKIHGLMAIYAENDDTFTKIATETGLKEKNLKSFNEISGTHPLQRGEIVYLEKKKKKADKPYYDHVVTHGESMYSIAQTYGIQVKSLYKMNKKKDNYTPVKGDVLKLR